MPFIWFDDYTERPPKPPRNTKLDASFWSEMKQRIYHKHIPYAFSPNDRKHLVKLYWFASDRHKQARKREFAPSIVMEFKP